MNGEWSESGAYLGWLGEDFQVLVNWASNKVVVLWSMRLDQPLHNGSASQKCDMGFYKFYQYIWSDAGFYEPQVIQVTALIASN